MDFVLDTNIVISALITPNGTISKLILNDLSKSRMICPEFLFEELIGKFDKIKQITGLKTDQLTELLFRFIKHIDFVDDNLIERKYKKQAYDLVKEIDKKDVLFVALSLQTGFTLWTGDKKLASGLIKIGFNQVIETKQLLELKD